MWKMDWREMQSHAEGQVRLLWWQPGTARVAVERRRVVGSKGCKYRICN